MLIKNKTGTDIETNHVNDINKEIIMPVLLYSQKNEALEVLYSLGAGDVEIEYVYQNDINADLVLETFPKAGDIFYNGDVVKIVISKQNNETSNDNLNLENTDNFEIDGTKLLFYIGNESIVKIPDGIETIGKASFCSSVINNNGIKEIIIPDSVKVIESHAFEDLNSLETIRMSDNIAYIPEYAFMNCKNLNSINMPKNLKVIAGGAFFNCFSLRNIELPNGLLYIGIDAFMQSGLIKINIPNNTHIKMGAFSYCKDLEEISFDNLTIENGCFYDTKWLDKQTEDFVVLSDTLLKYNGTNDNVNIPNNIKYIDVLAFKDCKTIKKVTISKNVIEIGDKAFYNCSNLEEVQTYNTLKRIGVNSFEKTKWLENKKEFAILGDSILIKYSGNKSDVKIPNNIKTIGKKAFYNNNCVKITIPPNVKKIEYGAFESCNNLEDLILPEELEQIPEKMCNSCPSLKIINFPMNSKIKIIGSNAFENCINLSTVNFSPNIRIILTGAFKGCSNLNTITINENCNYILPYSFMYCSSLEAIYIPKTVKTIGEYSFSLCTSLWDLKLGYGVQKIEEGAFSECSSLVNVSLPMSIKEIGLGCFMNCYNLQNIDSIGNIQEVPFNAFVRCTNLVNIKLPANLKKIGYNAFRSCSNLKNISLPENLETISIGAFTETGLEEIQIPGNVKTIDTGAFSYCINLEKVVFREGTENILPFVFFESNNIKSIYFPDSIKYIDDLAGINDNVILYCSNENKVIKKFAKYNFLKVRDY